MDNRRKSIVVNKPFQYQYSLLIAALTVLSVNIFLIIRMVFPGAEPLYLSTPMATTIAAVELLLVGSIWYASIRASFRIAGPVYVFARDVGRLGEGDLTVRIRLREKDMFTEEAESMNRSFAALNTRLSAVKTAAGQLAEAHARGEDLGPALEKLNGQLSQITTEKQE